jgi:carbonic anhydrase/acetyltransferase-like protein (isoleucine patch superfamily)
MTGPLIIPWKGKTPKIADDAFIAPNAVIIGDVEIGSKASIWFNCVLRGDVNYIRIGARTNIQDGTVIHVDSGGQPGAAAKGPDNGNPTLIGDDVLVGHMTMLHGCTCENGSFVGLCSTLMDGVVVESGAMVAAGALVTPYKRVLKGQLWAGKPARFTRNLTDQEVSHFHEPVAHYVELAEGYRKQLSR